MLIVPLLERFGRRPAMAMRLAGLVGFLYWSLNSPYPLSLHGRGLAILIMFAIGALGWARWGFSLGDDWTSQRGLTWEVLLLGIAGGLLIGAQTAGPGNAFAFVAAFTAGARAPLPRALIMVALTAIALCIAWIIYHVGGLGILAYVFGLVATAFGGAQRRDTLLRREQAELLLAQTQRSQEEALRNARLEESSRIAREIHDVLAHSLAGLTIQLEATAALIEGGADAPSILPRIQRAHELARDGLRETRLAVGALRGEGAAVVPAASRIEAIVGDFRAAGGSVELSIDGAREALSGPEGDAAVRIVQEALTNVTKHTPGADVRIMLTAGPPLGLIVESHSDGGADAPHPSLSDTGGGYGIAGMRERAEELGGSLAAGPTPRGWLVSASLGTE